MTSRRLWNDFGPPETTEEVNVGRGVAGTYEEQEALGWCRSFPNIRRRRRRSGKPVPTTRKWFWVVASPPQTAGKG